MSYYKSRSPYQTQHTYASIMLSAGEPLTWLSNQIGHSNVLTIAKIQAKFIPSAQPDVGEKGLAPTDNRLKLNCWDVLVFLLNIWF